MEQSIDLLAADDAEPVFSECLEQAMRKKRIFDPITHSYILRVMTEYVNWRSNEDLQRETQGKGCEGAHTRTAEFDDLKPTINNRHTRAFIFQISGIGEPQEYLNRQSRYDRLKSIGDTLLFAVGFWPESIAYKRSKHMGRIGYYATLGQEAYSRAADLSRIIMMKHFSEQSSILDEMSEGFRSYAAVLYTVRNDLGERPVTDIALLEELSNVLGDMTVVRRFLISMEEPKPKNS